MVWRSPVETAIHCAGQNCDWPVECSGELRKLKQAVGVYLEQKEAGVASQNSARVEKELRCFLSAVRGCVPLLCTLARSRAEFKEIKIWSGLVTHLLIDECAYASESDALVPIARCSSNLTKLVLVGDEFQLAPPIFCQKSRDFPAIQTSLFERLAEVYPPVQLGVQYRSR